MLCLLQLLDGQSVENVRILADSNGTTGMLQWRRDRVVGLKVGFLLFLSVCGRFLFIQEPATPIYGHSTKDDRLATTDDRLAIPLRSDF